MSCVFDINCNCKILLMSCLFLTLFLSLCVYVCRVYFRHVFSNVCSVYIVDDSLVFSRIRTTEGAIT